MNAKRDLHMNLPRPAAWAVALLIVVTLTGSAQAFNVYNQTSYTVRVEVYYDDADFVEEIPPGESRGCHWSNTDCNPTGERTAILGLAVETLDSNEMDFLVGVSLQAGGYALLYEEDRSALGLAPQFWIESWDFNHDWVDDSYYGVEATQRLVRFLAVGDCQFDNGAHHDTRNENARITHAVMQNLMFDDETIRGTIYAGDLTQWGRVDEWEEYSQSIAGAEEFFYDGLGNHDISWDACVADNFPLSCMQPGAIASTVRNRKHRTTKTNKAPGNDPHYSWDWHDVHFVQLNLFPGNAPSPAHPLLNPANALTFLVNDLATHVGDSGRPVVLIHHYGFDEFSKGGWWNEFERVAYWNALKPYNVAGIFTGHQHLDHSTDSSNPWRIDWERPALAVGGPDSIPTFVSSASFNGLYLDAVIDDGNTIVVKKKNQVGDVLGPVHCATFHRSFYASTGAPAPGYGTSGHPYQTISRTLAAVAEFKPSCVVSGPDFPEIVISGGTYDEAVTFDERMTVKARYGVAVIGASE